jgi:hypothetical protein
MGVETEGGLIIGYPGKPFQFGKPVFPLARSILRRSCRERLDDRDDRWEAISNRSRAGTGAAKRLAH